MLCLSGFELYYRWVPLKILDSKILQLIKVVAFFSDIENYQSNNDPLLNVKIFFSAKKK